jgi:hypothetical protein
VYNYLAKRSRRHDLDKDVLRSISRAAKLLDGENKSNNHLPAPEPKHEYDEDLIREQLARNYAFFGDEAMAKVRKGTVVVVGCGGVGSWAAVMLVRS